MVFPRLIQIKEFICFHKADARNALPVRVTVLLTPVLTQADSNILFPTNPRRHAVHR